MKWTTFLICLGTLFLFHGAQAQETGKVIVSVDRPWNGYWWPLKKGALVTGNGYHWSPSPLMKFEHQQNPFNDAFLWELENHYFPEGEGWWGHCNGWAAASILEPEPPALVKMRDTEFYYGDLSGILTALYQGSSGSVYGHRYTGSPSDDKLDVDPLTFQQVLELYMKVNGVPIIIDVDPGIEVWSYPAYMYVKSWTTIGSTIHVVMEVRFATDHVIDPDTPGNDYYRKIYTYDIETDGQGNEISGQWTNESVDDHPDFLWYPDSPSSGNPYITDGKVKEVLDYSGATDDDDKFEENDSASEAKPFHSSVYGRLLDDDWYSLKLSSPESGSIVVTTKQLEPDESWSPVVYGRRGFQLYEMQEVEAGKWELPVSVDTDTEWLVKIPERAGYSGNYFVSFNPLTTTMFVPHFPVRTGWYSSVLFENMSVEEAELNCLSQTVSGNSLSFAGWWLNEREQREYVPTDSDPFVGKPDWLRVISTTSDMKGWWICERYMGGDDNEMTLVELEKPDRDFVIPHIPESSTFWWVGLSLLNSDLEAENNLRLRAFSNTGVLLDERTIVLPPHVRWMGLIEDMYPDLDWTTIGYIEGRGEKPVSGEILYGTRDQKELTGLMGHLGFVGNESTIPLHLMEDSDAWIGVVLINKGSGTATIQMEWRNSKTWDVLGSKTIYLNANEKKVFDLETIRPDGVNAAEANRVEIHSNISKLTGFLLCGSHDQRLLSGYPLRPMSGEDSKTFVFPLWKGHYEKTEAELVVQNFEVYSRTVQVRSFSEDGSLLGEQSFVLEAGEQLVLKNGEWPVDNEHDASEVASVEVVKNSYVMAWMRFYQKDRTAFELLMPAGN
jgi:hypothetical protein